MKQMKNSSRRKNRTTMILVIAAVALLAFSALQSTRAALTYVSQDYTASLAVSEIGVTLQENGNDISSRNYSNNDWHETTGTLLTNMIAPGDKFLPGKAYDEKISVLNSGKIDEYVRVTITKSWTRDGEKVTTLSPDYIELGMADSGWLLDQKASTNERLVYYYPSVLAAGAATGDLTKDITINNAIASKYTETTTSDGTYTTITTTYQYDGVQFNVDAEVDAVQTHNAQEAIKSAWGVDVNVDAKSGNISLQ